MSVPKRSGGVHWRWDPAETASILSLMRRYGMNEDEERPSDWLRKRILGDMDVNLRLNDMIRDLKNRIAALENQASCSPEDMGFMKLPVDRDGKPIRPGETVYDRNGKPYKVIAVSGQVSWFEGDDRNPVSLLEDWVSHEQPDSWEKLEQELREALDDGRTITTNGCSTCSPAPASWQAMANELGLRILPGR